MGFEEEWQDLIPGDGRIPEVGVAVGGADGEVWRGGDELLFPACSVSKHVAAFGVLRLVADGTIDLDADVDDCLTGWRLPGSGTVTVRQLLGHTAGLTANWYPGYPEGDAVPSLLQVLRGEAPATTPPVRRELEPGTTFRYSGSHYSVLEQLLIDVTGTPFAELMKTLVLEPVGMVDSSYDQRFPYERRDRVAGRWNTQPETAAAGMWSTPVDLVRFERELLRAVAGESALLSRELAAEMVTPLVSDVFGLGTELGAGRYGHTGQNTGYSCFSFVWPASGTAVAVMTSADDCVDTLSNLLELAGAMAVPADRG